MLVAGLAPGAEVGGALEFVQRELNGAAEVAGLAGDLGGVPGIVGQQPGHDFGAGLAAEEGAELEEEVAGVIHARLGGEAAIADGPALPAADEEVGIGGPEMTRLGKEGRRRGHRAGRLGEDEPFFVRGLAVETDGDGGEHGGIAERVLPVQADEALEVDPVGLVLQPVEYLVEEAGIEAREGGGGEQEGFGIKEDIAGGGIGLAGNTERDPLAPEQIKGGRAGLRLKVVR